MVKLQKTGGSVEEIRPNQSGLLLRRLREEILKGVLPAGMQLVQDQLAARFGVSKVPLREALHQLAAEGFIELRPRRGAVVTEVTLAEVIEMLDIRLALERRAMELAIPNVVDSDVKAVKDILEVYSKQTNFEDWIKYNFAFHFALCEPCGRPMLLQQIKDVHDKMRRSFHLRVGLETSFDRCHREHELLIEAYIAKDVSKAVRLFVQHIEGSQMEVLAAERERKRQERALLTA